MFLSALLAVALLPQGVEIWKDPDEPLAARVDDLVSRMTLEEKVSQMTHEAAGISRLGIPKYNWWSECLHGVGLAGEATVFPQSIGLGATWDASLIHQVADAISTEGRAKHHDAIRNGKREIFYGLTFWSPNVNIFRDPRWGRGQETYGEDPLLTASLGCEFVTGLQGDDPKYFKVISTPKHFAVHSGPEPLRHVFDAKVGLQDLYATYLPHFERTIKDAGAFSVMGAYNRINSYPANASPLLGKVLRGEWGFKGYVVSDCGAIDDIFQGHHWTDSKVKAVAAAVKAGCDLECGSCYPALVEAVKQGLLSEADITRSVKRLMEARFRLGMFDPDSMVGYSKITIAQLCSPAHRAIALKAARESLVLLKNDKETLPLGPNIKRIAVIGPNADDVNALVGNYSGVPRNPRTPWKGIKALAERRGIQVTYTRGCGLTGDAGEPVPATALLAPTGKPGGLFAEYYDNEALRGQPVLTRREAVSFEWGSAAPDPALPADRFSVRWTGSVVAETTGSYSFGFTHDDGARIWVNGKMVVDDWIETPPKRSAFKVAMVAHQPVDIKIEYFEREVGAVAKLDWATPNAQPFTEAVAAARNADAVVMVLGIQPSIENEGLDREYLGLPDVQQRMLEAVTAVGKPVILVTLSGSPLSIPWASAHVPAILQAWYPGEEGGTAVAEALLGDYNPGGRLPVTVVKGLNQLPSFTDYAMKGRTYRYMTQQPLYQFGYGLSYTRFEYSELRVSREGNSWVVSAWVKNMGKRAGDEVAQLYLSHTLAPFPAPIRELRGFKRLSLSPGQARKVEFNLSAGDFQLVNLQGKRVPTTDPVVLTIGGSQPGKGCLSTRVTGRPK